MPARGKGDPVHLIKAFEFLRRSQYVYLAYGPSLATTTSLERRRPHHPSFRLHQNSLPASSSSVLLWGLGKGRGRVAATPSAPLP
mmetsp:Transcript_17434/g.37320  ORF Transcript_17434/g.37320 Transcript_17434/m.37320 type:complete len:85 (+) Transcript_17434:290-544(+)